MSKENSIRLVGRFDKKNGKCVSEWEYDEDGNIIRFQCNDEDRVFVEYWKYSNGREIEYSTNRGHNVFRYYDEFNRLKYICTAEREMVGLTHHIAEFKYNKKSKIIGMDDTIGRSSSYLYDANDNLIVSTGLIFNKKNTYEYNDDNKLIAIKCNNKSDIYTYLDNGNVVRTKYIDDKMLNKEVYEPIIGKDYRPNKTGVYIIEDELGISPILNMRRSYFEYIFDGVTIIQHMTYDKYNNIIDIESSDESENVDYVYEYKFY